MQTGPECARHPELAWLDRLWMLPGLLLAAACYLAGGWAGVVYGFCLGVVLVFQVTFAVNSVGHRWGRRFATGEGSRNNLVLGYLAMGDGWHNNHHRTPASARHGLVLYEFDLTYRAIRLLAWLGLAWAVREPRPPSWPPRGHRPRRRRSGADVIPRQRSATRQPFVGGPPPRQCVRICASLHPVPHLAAAICGWPRPARPRTAPSSATL